MEIDDDTSGFQSYVRGTEIKSDAFVTKKELTRPVCSVLNRTVLQCLVLGGVREAWKRKDSRYWVE